MNPEATTNGACSAFEEALQVYLDGSHELPPACQAHQAACARCRSHYLAAQRLTTSLRNRSPVSLPDGLTDRLVNSILADAGGTARREPHWSERLLVVVAAAACLLLALSLSSRWSMKPTEAPLPAPAPYIAASPQPPAPISVDQSLNEASAAIASLTRKTASQTPDPAKWLPAEPLKMTDPLPDPIPPAAQSLAEIRQGAASGFEPMTNSARRAFNLFVRDLPAPGDKKPDF